MTNNIDFMITKYIRNLGKPMARVKPGQVKKSAVKAFNIEEYISLVIPYCTEDAQRW